MPVTISKSTAGAQEFTGAATLDAGALSAADIEVTDHTKGLILQSPDGTRYRIAAANGGTLTLTGL